MRVLVVDNLRAGLGDPALYDYVRELGRRGAEVTLRFLTEGVDLAGLLADATSFDRVVAAGGDGTVSGVTYLLRNTGIPVVAYPAGTANLLAANLRMPADPIHLAELTARGTPVRTDLGEIRWHGPDGSGAPERTAGFVIMAGAGFDAAIMEGAADLKQSLGMGAYFLSVIGNLTPTVAQFRLELDDRVVETDGIAVVLVNFGRVQFDLSVTHNSDAQDGLLEVVVVRSKNVAGLLPAVWAALLERAGQQGDRSPSLEIHSARRIRVEADPPLPMQFDGEIAEASTPFEAVVLPGAATLVAPSETTVRSHDEYAEDRSA